MYLLVDSLNIVPLRKLYILLWLRPTEVTVFKETVINKAIENGIAAFNRRKRGNSERFEDSHCEI